MTTVTAEDKGFGTAFLEIVIGWIEANLSPENVFDYIVLSGWALDNGFEKQESPDSDYMFGRS